MCWRYMNEPATLGAALGVAFRAPALAVGGALGEPAAAPVKTWN